MQLKEDLTLIQRGSRTVSEFLHAVKMIADELSLIDAPVSDDDLTLYVLNGLDCEFRDMVAPIRTRETALSFAELHDLLIGHEHYLKHMDGQPSSNLVVTANSSQRRSSNPRFKHNKNRFNRYNTGSTKRSSVVCQICDHPGHTAKNCVKLQSSPSANYTTSSTPSKGKWLLDSAASHNITSDLANLSIHFEYDGQDEVVLGDGTCLHIANIVSTAISSLSRSLCLKDALHVPLLHKNLISIHKFTHDNNVVVEFHPFFYLVKDPITGAVLMRGRCEDGVYPVELCPPSSQAHVVTLAGTRASLDRWHHRLGHPSSKLLSSLLRSYNLPMSSSQSSLLSCVSCHCNKSHKLPFSVTSLTSHAPLEYLYADVWCPSLVPSIDGYRYYVLFVDHFTKYCWFYPMHNKSNVSPLFVQFATMIENQFSRKIKILTTVVNLSNLDLFWLLVVLVILPLHRIPLSKMALLNVASDILSILVWPFYIMLQSLPLIGHMPWLRQFILLIIFPLYYTHVRVLLKFYLEEFRTIISCAYLDVNAIPGLFHIVQISFNPNPILVSFLGIPTPNMHSNVYILQQVKFISCVMLLLMKAFFLLQKHHSLPLKLLPLLLLLLFFLSAWFHWIILPSYLSGLKLLPP
jgi:hypothetical protein